MPVSKEMYFIILPDGIVSVKRLKDVGGTEVNGHHPTEINYKVITIYGENPPNV
ncbi:hypothetical protein AN214_02665 [Pseudoalteromonas sp. P1-9]|nr:hypothetical protein AN214_02665 [Pseudoalteromonas sp. P1-9]